MSRSAAVISFAICLALCMSSAQSARILGLFPSPSKSHLLIHMAVAKTLADSGHNVTVVATLPDSNPSPNYKYVKLGIPEWSPALMTEIVNKPKPFYQRFSSLTDTMLESAERALLSAEMQRLLKEEEFDLVILGYFMNDFLIGVASHFSCPIIINFMIQPVPVLNRLIGNPDEVAYVPNIFTGLSQPLTYVQRVKNFVFNEIIERFLFGFLFERKVQAIYDNHFPAPKYRSLNEMKKNVSLLMVNHHFSQGPIRPNVPALVEIGGIQINENLAPLSEKVQNFLDSAEDTVIYFSFGSNVRGDTLNKEKAKTIFNVLSQLPYRVLAKWDEGDYPGESSNILYESWFPQDSVLAHPKVKLFLTHGGTGSIVESQYHGVPMVGIPLFGDQASNMAVVQRAGYGVSLDFATLTEDALNEAIDNVLSNPQYTEKVQKFSTLYKDRPMSPRQTVNYWVDYVLRHRGAPHIQSPLIHLNWFQQRSLDVIAFLLVAVFIIFKILAFICKLLKSTVLYLHSKFVRSSRKVKTN